MGPATRRRRFRSAATLVAVWALGLAACGVEAGTAVPEAVGPVTEIVGNEADVTTTTEADETTTTVAPPTDVEIVGAVDSDVNEVAANAIADLEAWWADAYPEAYGEPYEPLAGGTYAIDSGTDPRTIPCGLPSISDMLDNAYYCPPDDAVVWDQERFMPELAEAHGLFTVAVVIAHEWGHVIQDRARFDEASVILELQADCFAGAWTQHVVSDSDARLRANTLELDQALAGVLSLRDAPGGSADDPLAHGSGFDRVGAFQDGFESGVTRCAEYENGDPAPYQFPFTSQDDLYAQGDLPLSEPGDTDDIIDLTFPSLDAYWADTFPSLGGGEYVPLDAPVAFAADDPPDCGGESVEDFLLFVCIPDRFVGFEVDEMLPAAYRENGDFAVATLFATQYGLDVVAQLDAAGDEVAATLQGDCYAGSWAAAILPPDPPEEYQLVLSPGDLDEAVAVLLSFRSDADRERQGPGFDRVRAFRIGVIDGAEACAEVEGS